MIGIRDKTMIIRLMDDYLIVSIDKTCIQHFLQRAHNSLKHYGGGVNPLKTKVNFDIDIEYQGEKITLSRIADEYMSWCGYSFDTETLDVSPNYDRLLERPLSSSFLSSPHKPGVALRKMMKSFARMKCHALVLDKSLNSFETVVKTIYRIFLITAYRSLSYIRRMCHKACKSKNPHYLLRCIKDTISFESKLIHSRTRFKGLRKFHIQINGDKPNNNALTSFEKLMSSIYFDINDSSVATTTKAMRASCEVTLQQVN